MPKELEEEIFRELDKRVKELKKIEALNKKMIKLKKENNNYYPAHTLN